MCTLTFVFLVFSCLFSLKSEGVFGMLSCSQLFIHLMFWRKMLVNMTSYGWRVLACLISLIRKNSTGFWTSHFCLLLFVFLLYSVVFLCCIALCLLCVVTCWSTKVLLFVKRAGRKKFAAKDILI